MPARAPRPYFRCPPGFAVLVATCWAATGQAGEFYGTRSMTRTTAGYAALVNDALVLRVDYASSRTGPRSGHTRIGLFADHFPMSNGFRLTSGLTINHMKARLNADFNGGTANLGRMDDVGNGAYINARIHMPRVTPYVGIGWGHHRREPGWGLVADVGMSIGTAKVEVDTNLASFGVPQADIDRRIGELRDAARDIRVIPQASVGMSYRY